MARWVQFGFAVCFAMGLGVYLGGPGSRSLEKLMEKSTVLEKSGSFSAVQMPSEAVSTAALAGPEIKGGGVSGPKNRPPAFPAELEIQEAKQSVLALLNENKRFRKEVLDLEGQIRRLTHSLAEEKLKNDRLRVKISGIQDKRTEVNVPGQNIPEICEVIDINKELNLVVLNRGLSDGIQHGMQLTVVREGSRIADVEAVNVRSRITGAAIKFLKENEAVVAGDRVIPARN